MKLFIIASIVVIVAASQQSNTNVTNASRFKKYAIPITQQQFIPYEVIKYVEVPAEKVELNIVEKKIPYFVDTPYPVIVERHVKVPIPKPYPVHVPVRKHVFYHHYKGKRPTEKDQ